MAERQQGVCLHGGATHRYTNRRQDVDVVIVQSEWAFVANLE
jgi:hypothetical protein